MFEYMLFGTCEAIVIFPSGEKPDGPGAKFFQDEVAGAIIRAIESAETDEAQQAILRDPEQIVEDYYLRLFA